MQSSHHEVSADVGAARTHTRISWDREAGKDNVRQPRERIHGGDSPRLPGGLGRRHDKFIPSDVGLTQSSEPTTTGLSASGSSYHGSFSPTRALIFHARLFGSLSIISRSFAILAFVVSSSEVVRP